LNLPVVFRALTKHDRRSSVYFGDSDKSETLEGRRSYVFISLQPSKYFSSSAICSTNWHWLTVGLRSCRLSTYGPRAFPVPGPTVWNSLTDKIRYHRHTMLTASKFKQFFKTILFSFSSALDALKVF